MSTMPENVNGIDSVLPKLNRKSKAAYVKDADLQIHVPEVGDSLDLEKTHSFKDILSRYVEDVNTLQHDADTELQRLISGETEDLHTVQLKMNEAKKSFELMLQIHTKLEDMYKEFKSMQMH
ncbi:MAG: Flagellar hook-basal body complex protein FliE [Chlamydiales bacterium]|jgi:flagellar hook-basal body complex protein FliE|nr:Flagellar hook-basal body complex protein FliE [Chlamydiales bacterium]